VKPTSLPFKRAPRRRTRASKTNTTRERTTKKFQRETRKKSETNLEITTHLALIPYDEGSSQIMEWKTSWTEMRIKNPRKKIDEGEDGGR